MPTYTGITENETYEQHDTRSSSPHDGKAEMQEPGADPRPDQGVVIRDCGMALQPDALL